MSKGLCAAVLVVVVAMLFGCGAAGNVVESGTDVASAMAGDVQVAQEPPVPESAVSSAVAEQALPDREEDSDTPVLGFETSYTDLSFLNEEQRAAFTFVMENYNYLGHGNDGWRGYRDENDNGETVEIDGRTFYLSGYGLHEWEDFYAYWTAGFEKEYFDGLLEKWGSFVEYDGKAWALGGGGSGTGLWPVGYEISEITDDYIAFYIRSYGQEKLDGEFVSQFFHRVTLSLTEDGWRCTEFPWI